MQDAVLFVKTQPEDGTQESFVQPFPSLQVRVPDPMHAPPEQVSTVVQRLLSVQGFVLFAYTQPVAGMQVSVVQMFPSLQVCGAPG